MPILGRDDIDGAGINDVEGMCGGNAPLSDSDRQSDGERGGSKKEARDVGRAPSSWTGSEGGMGGL